MLGERGKMAPWGEGLGRSVPAGSGACWRHGWAGHFPADDATPAPPGGCTARLAPRVKDGAAMESGAHEAGGRARRGRPRRGRSSSTTARWIGFVLFAGGIALCSTARPAGRPEPHPLALHWPCAGRRSHPVYRQGEDAGLVFRAACRERRAGSNLVSSLTGEWNTLLV